jgi:hypothetical protein
MAMETGAQDEFLVSLKLQNNLPSAPSGPFLKNVSISNSFDEFSPYFTSTLEKGFVWQPRFGPQLGIKVDFVDEEALHLPDVPPVLDQSDVRYLTGSIDKSRGKNKQVDQASKPWWLRNTTYMENNLYNLARAKAKNEASKSVSAKRAADVDYDKDMLSTEFINESFDIVAKTIASLVAKNPGNKLLRNMPLVPLDTDESNSSFAARQHSLIRFDEDPVVDESVDVATNKAKNGKKRKVDVGIVTNLRQSVKSESLPGTVLEVSLVSPFVASAATGSGDINGSHEKKQKYGWVNDYRMDLQQQHTQLTDSFLFVSQNRRSNGSELNEEDVNSSVAYFPLSSRVDMKKMNPEDSVAHDCTIIRE